MSAPFSSLPYGETLDAFHRGAFYLVQPSAKGHRSGIDAMILASAVPADFKGKVADLGAGAGAAGLAGLGYMGSRGLKAAKPAIKSRAKKYALYGAGGLAGATALGSYAGNRAAG